MNRKELRVATKPLTEIVSLAHERGFSSHGDMRYDNTQWHAYARSTPDTLATLYVSNQQHVVLTEGFQAGEPQIAEVGDTIVTYDDAHLAIMRPDHAQRRITIAATIGGAIVGGLLVRHPIGAALFSAKFVAGGLYLNHVLDRNARERLTEFLGDKNLYFGNGALDRLMQHDPVEQRS